jgi:MoxR-like ATPase
MLEGPAGAGKTELAQAVARAYQVPLLRLQCYQGINEEKAIGQYDKSLQELYVLLMSKSTQAPDWAEIKREVTSRAFFMAGPLLEAIEQEMSCVLLIDEIDKVDYAFEAMLLELLSAWTLSIPKMGTLQATSIPHVFLTSNQERRLGDPLRRRSFYLVIEHPTAEREAAIVAKRTPQASAATHRFIAGLAKSLRAYTMEKAPSISEMNDLALAMELLGIDEVLPEHKDIVLPLIAKTEGDRKRLLMKEAFESIVRIAGRYAAEMPEGVELRAVKTELERK